MNREEIINMLIDLSGPDGPYMGYIDPDISEFDRICAEDREETRAIRQMVNALPIDNLEIFLDIVLNPFDVSKLHCRDFVLDGLPATLTLILAQFKLRDNIYFMQQYQPYLQFDVMQEELEKIEEKTDDLIGDDCIDAIYESHQFIYTEKRNMSDNDWKIYIIRAIYEGIKDIDNDNECRLLSYYIRSYDDYISSPSKIESVELNAIWNFADVTFFYYNNCKKEKWLPMLTVLRDSVELLKNGKHITNTWVLNMVDTHLKREILKTIKSENKNIKSIFKLW